MEEETQNLYHFTKQVTEKKEQWREVVHTDKNVKRLKLHKRFLMWQ